MIPKVKKSINQLIISILENDVFDKLNKSRKDFIVSVLWHILSIKGRINFLQLGRFSPLCEQTFRNQFEKEFDFYSFNKQFTGLTNCQGRSKNKLDFHFNATLTAINLAKQDWLSTKGNEDKPFSMSDYKTMYNNTLMPERFMCMFAINPNTPKNQKIVKELLNYGKIAA